MKGGLLVIILLLFSLNFISAITCNPTSISRSVNVGQTPSSETVTCTNNNNYNVSLFKSGDFFTTNPSIPISIPNNSQSTFAVNFNLADIEGNFTGFVYSSDGTTLNINVNAQQEDVSYSGIIVFPTSKIINIQQGQTKSQSIQIIVPEDYPNSIKIQSISTNPDLDTLRFDDLNLGVLNPGQTLNIPLIIDAVDSQVGTYTTQINILATNSTGQLNLPPANIQIIVSLGISPATNETFSAPPVCSISATEFNLNQTYLFSCSNVVNNIDIITPYNEYLEGLRVETGGGTYKAYFKAIKLGTSTFLTTFSYKGFTIFPPFKQEFKITPSGASSIGDINMKAQFFQFGVEKTKSNLQEGETAIVMLDNKTENLVKPFVIILDGEELNATKINLESGKTYHLRITAESYNDFVIENMSVSQNSIEISVTPSKDNYYVGEQIQITTNVNASILVNDVVVAGNYYTINRIGNSTIKAIKEGYKTTEKTISATSMISLDTTSCTLEPEKWKKGSEIVCSLNEDANWTVYLNNTLINSGNGKEINFDLDTAGNVEVRANDIAIWSQLIESKGIGSWIKEHWVWSIVIGLLILSVGYLIYINRGGEDLGSRLDSE